MTTMILIIWLALSGVIAYRRMGAWPAWTASVVMLIAALLGETDIWLITLIFIVASGLFIFAMDDLRKRFISGPVFNVMARAAPNISQTEREALEAGTVWWDRDLFSGHPDWQKLKSFAAPSLTAEEQAFLDGPVETLCGIINDWAITHEQQDLPPEVWEYMKQTRFFGMIIPKQYEGLGFSAQAHSAVVAKLSTRSISAAVTVMVPNSLGPGELLLHYGTEQQKAWYLPRLARGEEIPCFALTGPEAGSDAAATPDHGTVCAHKNESGEMELGIRLNWNKRYITLAPVATVIGVAFRLFDPEHLLGNREDIGITCALVARDTPGVEIGRRHAPLDMAFMNGPTRGKDVFIPIESVIGGREYVGKGWRMLMESLAAGRCISLPALSVGGVQLAARSVGAYARIRRQFNTSIGNFEGIQEALAQIGGNAYQMDAARQMTLVALDAGERPSVISAILKYHLTEKLRNSINHAMDVVGGAGICLGPRNLFGRAYQSLPIAITVEGANIMTRSLIIFGQGAMRAHPTLLKELRALESQDVDVFDRALTQHIGNLAANLVRSFWLGIGGGRLHLHPRGEMARHYDRLGHLSSGFALISDLTLMLLGASLKRRERISARLGDALSHLYLASATIKRFVDEGEHSTDLPLFNWAMARACFDAQQALIEVLRNYPSRTVAMLARLLVFPLGGRYRKPDDRMDAAVAALLTRPGEARDRLTGLVYTGGKNQPVGRLDTALRMTLESEEVEKILKRALGRRAMTLDATRTMVAEGLERKVITLEQADIVLNAARARNEVIQVDAFNGQDKNIDQGQSIPEAKQ